MPGKAGLENLPLTAPQGPLMALRLTKTEKGGESVWFWCAGCDTHHRYQTKLGEGETGPVWKFNGNLEKPTFTPSLMCNRDNPDPERGVHLCHLYVTDGMVRYLPDCTHELKGKTVPVEDPCFG